MTINEGIYSRTVLVEGWSVFTGGSRTKEELDIDELPDTGIIREWLKDDDIQQITVVSSSIGLTRTFSKQYVKRGYSR